MPTLPPPAESSLVELERLERRLELLLKDLRIYRQQRIREESSGGVLGSRGLTEYMIDTLRAGAGYTGISVRELLIMAEHAGYKVPTLRTMSKRLTERAYRVGDIAWSKELEWYWRGKPDGN